MVFIGYQVITLNTDYMVLIYGFPIVGTYRSYNVTLQVLRYNNEEFIDGNLPKLV